jgi:DNA double-strand break repair and V(D)J recombination protein XRCC4
LCHIFNPSSAASLPNDQSKGLEVVAVIARGKATITLRNRIDKITQRLGSVELSQDDDAEIQLFEWCGSAIDQRTALEIERSNLRIQYESAQDTILSLESKLEDLVKAKADHEEELISKFVLLLNEKKLKIRNQQRFLSTAKVDQKKWKQMEKTLDGKGRQAGSSRSGKRRADKDAEEAGEQNDSSDAFEKMDVDQQLGIVAGSQEAASERQTTPETETATESDADPAEPTSRSSLPPEASQPNRSKASKKPTSPPANTHKTRQTRTTSASPPPPVRQLPFAKKGANTQKASEPEGEPEKQQPRPKTQAPPLADDSGEETASEDDEL